MKKRKLENKFDLKYISFWKVLLYTLSNDGHIAFTSLSAGYTDRKVQFIIGDKFK